jgi:hypothetical protein
MLSRAARNVLIGKCQGNQKKFVRAILTSKDPLYQQPLANNREDVTIYTPFASIDYPKVRIDQFVWADVNKWMDKTAIVSRN